MPAFMHSADVLLVHLRRSHIADHAIPTKILAYLAAGRPVVCATGGAAADLVRSAKAGVTSEPGDAAALVEAILAVQSLSAEARAALGRNGRAHLQAHFDKRSVIDGYEQVLESLVRPDATALHSAERV